jgi:hypothetical protein
MQEFKTYTVEYSTTAVVLAADNRNCKLHTVLLPKTTVGTVTFATYTATEFTLPASTVAGCYFFDSVFGDGLKMTTSSTQDYVMATIASY